MLDPHLQGVHDPSNRRQLQVSAMQLAILVKRQSPMVTEVCRGVAPIGLRYIALDYIGYL